MGFPISHKENENRRAIVPEHIKMLQYPEQVYIERGYGEVLGATDDDYKNQGCRVVSREEVLAQSVICDPKIGDAEYLEHLHAGQSIFGWVHATQNRDITDKIIRHKLTAYAWENMHYNGRHIFWRNNELAGEAAVMHAFQCYGRMPYETKVAVLGRGNTARGAVKVLNMLGADVMQYDRRSESLFREEIGMYDVIVNCILWDVTRTDHIVYKSDLGRMKRNAMIVDVSCDRNGGIETSIPTTIENPTYLVDGILHYVVDHTPSLFYKTFTWNNSQILIPYIEELIGDRCGKVLEDSVVIRNGVIVDPSIRQFQNR
ncbi:N(5)-(carboxyethyl)ornithine synthase [uncultured Fibrobacter sp.]|uniref:N(5)-(carboxyethyl)ornithine synthase n=1 Tax=uncultured Fibrobacter sp. TaxID=261512 RepID=UPI0028063747|nr:N(5)-(carboxyethyl)ornithine synthase [uncultured Fibrobacter sp.]